VQALDHVSITVREIARVQAFYDAIFEALSLEKLYQTEDAAGYGEHNRAGADDHSYLSIYQSGAATAGLRPNYHPAYYAAFLEDPEGNRIEAVTHRGDDS
jgi:catechol 2,3-dioxygenase-like lactoylglutathione lyase family enzyme